MPLIMLGSAPGTCQVCATRHEPKEPHNAQSLPYQMWFKATYGRGATWADAIAHCSPELAETWEKELKVMDHWSEPSDGTVIAVLDKTGGIPTTRPLQGTEPVFLSIKMNR